MIALLISLLLATCGTLLLLFNKPSAIYLQEFQLPYFPRAVASIAQQYRSWTFNFYRAWIVFVAISLLTGAYAVFING